MAIQRRRRGRPRSEDTASGRITIRITEATRTKLDQLKELWRRYADEQLSDARMIALLVGKTNDALIMRWATVHRLK